MPGLAVLFLLLIAPTVALAQTSDPPTATAAVTSEGAEREALEVAKARYFAGGHADALTALRALAHTQRNPPQQTEVAAEVLVYLGEIEFVTGDRAASWHSFQELATRWPDYSISPLHHPSDVAEWFDLVARQARSAEPDAQDRRQRAPLWTLAPLGVPQRRLGLKRAGVGYGTAQVVFGVTSVASLALLVRFNGPHHPPGWTGDVLRRRVNALRWGVQIPATAAFWASYAASVGTARRELRHSPSAALSVGISAEGLALSGRF